MGLDQFLSLVPIRPIAAKLSDKGIKTAQNKEWSVMPVKRDGAGSTTRNLMDAGLEVMVSEAMRSYGHASH
jgi:hypothetical protein